MPSTWGFIGETSDLSISGIDTNRAASQTAGIFADQAVVLTASNILNLGYTSRSGEPNNDAWGEIDTNGVTLAVSSGNMNIRARVRFHRVNSSGTIQQSTSYTAYQTVKSVQDYNFSIFAFVWTSGACGDRIVFDIEFENLNTMATESVTYDLFDSGAVDDESFGTMDIDESGSCTGVVRRVFLIT